MTIRTAIALTLGLGFGLATFTAPAEAAGPCPKGWNPYHGTCVGPNGQTRRTWQNSPQGFYPIDRDDNVDRRLRNLPDLPRGQHYEVINGRVVRVYDDRSYDNDFGGNNGTRALQGLLNQLLN